MQWLGKWRHCLRALCQKRKLDAEMDNEMRLHIELKTRANMEAGKIGEFESFSEVTDN